MLHTKAINDEQIRVTSDLLIHDDTLFRKCSSRYTGNGLNQNKNKTHMRLLEFEVEKIIQQQKDKNS